MYIQHKYCTVDLYDFNPIYLLPTLMMMMMMDYKEKSRSNYIHIYVCTVLLFTLMVGGIVQSLIPAYCPVHVARPQPPMPQDHKHDAKENQEPAIRLQQEPPCNKGKNNMGLEK
jgi:hypothetical protein